MIRINLVPAGIQASSVGAQLSALPWKKIGIGACSFSVLYTVWLLGGNWLQAKQLSRLRSEWSRLQVEQPRLEQTEAALKALQHRASFLEFLKKPEARWAPRLNLLTDVLVSGLWFTDLEYGMSESGFGQTGNDFEEPPPISAPVEVTPPPLDAPSGVEGPPGSSPEGPPEAGLPAPAPVVEEPKRTLILKGSALVTDQGQGIPVKRYLQRLKDYPAFNRWFEKLELKEMEHRQVGQEQVSDYVVVLTPKGM